MVKDYVFKWILGIHIVSFLSASYGAGSETNSEYKGSQAFNNFISSIESVNPSTGTFGICKPLINQVGINEGVNLNLNLVYSPGSSGILGLPKNWIFDISYVIPSSSLTYQGYLVYQGKTFIIDYNWYDVGNYRSGLRYVNNHSLSFKGGPPNQPLPSGKKGGYEYRLTMGDGAHDYFDGSGKLVEHDDCFGNYISYAYKKPLKGVIGNYLENITDSFGQIFNFAYAGNLITLDSPNRSQTKLTHSLNGILIVSDNVKNQTTFKYDRSDNIIAISYPTGLKSHINYKAGGIPYLKDTVGNKGSFPAVYFIEHQGIDGSVLNRTQYEFGAEIRDRYFTGNPFYPLSNDSDQLMESGNTKYHYEVLISQMDTEGKTLNKQRTYYNYLHLPVHTRQYLDASRSSWYQTDFTYKVSNNRARATDYNKPITSVSSVYLNRKWILLNQSTTEYNIYGNSILSQQNLYDPNQSKFIAQSVSASTFTEVSWGGNKREMPKTVVVQDLITGYKLQTDYTLTPDTKKYCIQVHTMQ